jgi:hypothetical protein
MISKMPPWVYIAFGWAALLAASVGTIRVCNQNAPQSVGLDAPVPKGAVHAR